MGTQEIPDSNPESPKRVVDSPPMGRSMWMLLAGFLIPPAIVTFTGNAMGGMPNQTFWVIMLGLPIPVILFSLPRNYLVEGGVLTIRGIFYHINIPSSEIRSIEPISSSRALVHPSSVFCSDPSRALIVRRRDKMSIIISPKDPKPFYRLAGQSTPHNRGG